VELGENSLRVGSVDDSYKVDISNTKTSAELNDITRKFNAGILRRNVRFKV